mmetsp:Transcript_13182/g.39289  ORF Transcript_13182/g.39289 Transcript_13182/m.39289 type:complete len:307 (-) Transcript_13182:493-1413(-)
MESSNVGRTTRCQKTCKTRSLPWKVSRSTAPRSLRQSEPRHTVFSPATSSEPWPSLSCASLWQSSKACCKHLHMRMPLSCSLRERWSNPRRSQSRQCATPASSTSTYTALSSSSLAPGTRGSSAGSFIGCGAAASGAGHLQQGAQFALWKYDKPELEMWRTHPAGHAVGSGVKASSLILSRSAKAAISSASLRGRPVPLKSSPSISRTWPKRTKTSLVSSSSMQWLSLFSCNHRFARNFFSGASCTRRTASLASSIAFLTISDCWLAFSRDTCEMRVFKALCIAAISLSESPLSRPSSSKAYTAGT